MGNDENGLGELGEVPLNTDIPPRLRERFDVYRDTEGSKRPIKVLLSAAVFGLTKLDDHETASLIREMRGWLADPNADLLPENLVGEGEGAARASPKTEPGSIPRRKPRSRMG